MADRKTSYPNSDETVRHDDSKEQMPAVPVDGAFGDDPDHVSTGRRAGPDTNNFRCEAYGRWFNTKAEFDAHSPECQIAKAATAAGPRSLIQP